MKTLRPIFFTLLMLISAKAMCNDFARSEIFDRETLRDSLSLNHRPIYFDDERLISDYGYYDGMVDAYSPEGGILPKGGYLEYRYLKNRLSLTGETCTINKMVNSVGVGSWTDSLGNLLNEDLDDYCEFNAVASVGAAVNPIVSVRDNSRYFAKGTHAGFCLVAGSGNAVLSLDVIKVVTIGFYRDGELVGSVPVEEGQGGEGIALKLIQIPGSDDACLYLTAVAPGVFDEVMLDYAGLTVSAGQILRVKYAYVGKPREFTITRCAEDGSVSKTGTEETAFQRYNPEKYGDVDLDKVEGWDPVLLGIPFPFVKSDLEKFVDDDTHSENPTSGLTLTPILSVGYQGGAKFMMKHKDNLQEEVYEAGTEVGFVYDFGSGLSLDAGAWIRLILFDRNGNKVQEETVSADVLALNVAKGGDGMSSLVSGVPFSGAELRFHTAVSVNLGAIVMKYAFVREKPEARHVCPINPSASLNICDTQSSFQLRSNPDVSVSWRLVEQPEGANAKVSASGYVTDMTADGTYIFVAEAADGCSDEVALTKGGFGEEGMCGSPLANEDGKEPEYVALTTVPGESSGGLIQIDGLKYAENVVSHDFDTYAEYVGGLEVATNYPVIGVERINGLIYDATSEEEKYKDGKRVGFVVESAVEGLNLSLLQFLQIRCYYKGEEVYRHVIEESNAVSADVGGSNTATKIRYSILVPNIVDNGMAKIDRIVLWNSGVLDLKGSKLKIYYAFVEDADSDCNDPLGCDAQLLSTSETHTTLDFDLMQTGSAIVVANAVNDLSNLIDDDRDSFMSVANSVSVGSGIPIAVKLGRTLDYRHKLGIIMDNKTFVAGINAGSWLTVETYYNGVPTGDEMTDWNVVDANVAGYGDTNVIYFQPKTRYDEVKITIAKTIAALDVIKLYGLFIRGDVDNDGIPDCQDPYSCPSLVEQIEVGDVCVGSEVVVSAKGNVDADYAVNFSEPGVGTIKTTADAQGFFTLSYEAKTPGQYQMVFYDGSGTPVTAMEYSVHPLKTTWKTTASNDDWTKWDNWTDGVPYCCTDVVIPSAARVYPQLTGNVTEGDEFCCRFIHFEPGAEINDITKLNYEKAWVEFETLPNRYALMSSPLKKTYTGDMFVPADMEGVHSGDYFTVLNSTNSPENRFSPRVYQRLWQNVGSVDERDWVKDSETANSKKYLNLSGTEQIGNLSVTKWSKVFNHLAYEYPEAGGFSMWVDNEKLPEDTKFRFRLPKEHDTYNYYLDFDGDKIPDVSEKVTRKEKIGNSEEESDVAGRFIYEAENPGNVEFTKTLPQPGDESGDIVYSRTVYEGSLPYRHAIHASEVQGSVATSDYFLFGNPFMSNIDVRKFLRGNAGVISGLIAYDGNASFSIIYNPDSEQFVESSPIAVVAPMQSVVLIAKEESPSIEVTVTRGMLRTDDSGDSDSDDAEGGIGNSIESQASPSLRITMESAGIASSVVVAEGLPEGNPALLDGEVAPMVAVMALGDDEVYDIMPLSEEVPLTMVCSTGESRKIRFYAAGGFNRDDYRLRDMSTGMEYTLDNDILLPGAAEVSAGRWALVNVASGAGVDAICENNVANVYLEIYDGIARVRCVDENIKSIVAYDTLGTMLSRRDNVDSPMDEIKLGRGLIVVTVSTASGRTRSFKLRIS